jgi:hypothetical protein
MDPSCLSKLQALHEIVERQQTLNLTIQSEFSQQYGFRTTHVLVILKKITWDRTYRTRNTKYNKKFGIESAGTSFGVYLPHDVVKHL